LIKRKRGLFQGSILSPFLFNIIIDPLAQKIALTVPQTQILLFADDIAIKSPTYLALQAAIDECTSWQQKSKLKFNIEKCGIISQNASQPVVLDGDVIPVVQHYKYLGLIFDAQGVRWEEYIDKITNKYMGILRGLEGIKRRWTLSTRLAIFRSFVRPVIEYCLPLLTKWISRQDNKDYLFKKLGKLHKTGIEWIFDKRTPTSVLESMSGVGSFNFRVKQLEFTLANHLRTLNESNPLTVRWRSSFLSANKNFILSTTRSSELLTEWKSYIKNEKRPLKLRTWLKHKKIQSFLEGPGILQHYITNMCRAKSSMDICLTQKLNISRKAVSWRCNRAFSGVLCPVCGLTFNRGHLERCGIYNLIDTNQQILKLRNSNEYKTDLKEILNSITTHRKGNIINYTVFDYYLNRQNYEEFSSCFSRLRVLLYPHQENPPDLPS
jgi:hypothetical protein